MQAQKTTLGIGLLKLTVMIDSGCSSLLLPLGDAQLTKLPESFPSANYSWVIGHSTGVQAQSLVLRITPQHPSEFPIRPHDFDELQTFLDSAGNTEIPERSHALLGQTLLSAPDRNRATVQYKTIIAMVDTARFHFDGWNAFGQLEACVLSQAKLPSHFQDLEDDDDHHDDEEDTKITGVLFVDD